VLWELLYFFQLFVPSLHSLNSIIIIIIVIIICVCHSKCVPTLHCSFTDTERGEERKGRGLKLAILSTLKLKGWIVEITVFILKWDAVFGQG
jgi:ABC-type phosphate transport system permease subunit